MTGETKIMHENHPKTVIYTDGTTLKIHQKEFPYNPSLLYIFCFTTSFSSPTIPGHDERCV